MSYHFAQASTRDHLHQIKQLQLTNLKRSLTPEEIVEEGFVTCEHSMALLEKMNHPDGHILALREEEVVGYCLVMSPSWRDELDVLKPMFEKIERIAKDHETLSPSNYIVMGQVCIDKAHRRQGLFKGMYNYYRSCLSDKYRYCITEVATENTRSLSAHKAVGFEALYSYDVDDGRSWVVVIWDWSKHTTL